MTQSSTTSPAKKKSKPIQSAAAALKDDHSQQPSKNNNLAVISECGDNLASFLTFHERGRLLLVNHQLNDEMWGIIKEKTYCPSGKSAVEAAKLILRVARSEFGPERLLTDCCENKADAISALSGSSTDFDSYELSEYLEDWRELKKFWCPKKKCYDVTSIANGFPSDWEEDVREEMKSFFEKVNELFKKLKKCCLYLKKLEKKSAAFPDLYKLLIKKARVERAWLDRFAEIRNSTWGKAHFDDDNEPLSYHTRDRGGTLVLHSIDQVFPGQDTIRAIPSKNYKPKPLHFRECIKCHKVKFDISIFECPYKWCEHDHKGKCGDCAPTSKCSTCGKSGCLCCFVPAPAKDVPA